MPSYVAKYSLLILIITLWMPAATSIGDFNLGALLLPPIALIAFFSSGGSSLGELSKLKARLFVVVVVTSTIIAAWSAVSFLWAEQPLRVFRVAYGQLVGSTLLLFFIRSRDSSLWRSAFKLLVFCALASAALAIVSDLSPAVRALTRSTFDRTAGLFKQSNQLGIVLAMTLPVVLAYSLNRRGAAVFSVGLAAIMYLGLALSGSKTNLALASVFVFAFIVIVMIQRGTFIRAPAVATIVIGVFVVGAFGAYSALEYINPRAQRLLTTFAEDGTAPSVLARQLIWQDSIIQGSEHPLTGVGAGQTTLGGRFAHSHNVFIEFYRTLGVVGLGLIVTQIGACLALAAISIKESLGSRMPSERRAILAALSLASVSYIASNQTSDSFGPSTLPIFWFCIALLCTCPVAGWRADSPAPSPVRAGSFPARVNRYGR